MNRRRPTAHDFTAHDAPTLQTDLFSGRGAFGWPSHDAFPHNQDGWSVGQVVRRDLTASASPLVITGYASLERVIEWLAQWRAAHAAGPGPLGRVRLLLGHEPHPSARDAWPEPRQRLARAVRDYWFEAGVSLLLSGKVVAALELLHDGTLEVRTSGTRPVHAKMYVGDDAVTLGSSNFSQSGMAGQVEANARFTTAAEPVRHAEAVRLAEQIWREGDDYGAGFEALLRGLLRNVTWHEALARACAELLEGTWAARHVAGAELDGGSLLWPSQTQGIAHALWVLENQGSVLVADATGSGKTRTGVHLVQHVMARLWRTGRARSGLAVLMTPPSVRPDWEREADVVGLTLRVCSHGKLSRAHGGTDDTLQTVIRRAQLLVVDEAHNFLRHSNRTRALYAHTADHVLLFTATPINRGAEDLLALVNLLGPDNLDDVTLRAVETLWSRRRYAPDDGQYAEERDQLRRAIRRFVVRRTKTDLNRLVDQNPEAYRAPDTGRVHRYPRHEPTGYALGETDEDCRLTAEIRATAARLRGLAWFRAPLELSPALRARAMTEGRYMDQRLASAAALARHTVAAALRSSRARLIEHLRGTAVAVRMTPTLAHATPGIVRSGVIERTLELGGHPPRIGLDAAVPEWLRDPAAHAEAAREEAAHYAAIEALARRLSDAREQAKANLLVQLLGAHALVLAFDSYRITLHDLGARVRAHPDFRRGPSTDDAWDALVATGDATRVRRRLYEAFGPGSSARGIVALCSDAMSESVNLQAASAVVMLDTPSVIRVAEQRIGRVDRMNTTHDVVHAYWPIDAEPFALRSGERLVARHRVVREHLGSNLPLPASMTGDTARVGGTPPYAPPYGHGSDTRGADAASADAIPRDGEVIGYADYLADLAAHEARRVAHADLPDAFAPVRALVAGHTALVRPAVYAAVRDSQARVLAAVGVVRSATPFGFVAVAGTEYGAPKWAYFDGLTAQPSTDLDAIGRGLRARLGADPPDAPFDDAAAAVLERVLDQLAQHEEVLLPRAKQRALDELRWVCGRYRRAAVEDDERALVLDDVLRFAGTRAVPGPADRATLAAWWLRLVQPLRLRRLAAGRRRRPLLLKDLRRDLLQAPLTTEQLRTAETEPLVGVPIARRVVAAIVGVPTAE